MNWDALADWSLDGETITREQARAVLDAPDHEVLPLVATTSRVRRAFFGTSVKLNFLLNVKSGLCPEDCHYCSQSARSTAPVARYPMQTAEEMLAMADRAVRARASRLCMVASGRGPTDRELDAFAEGVRVVRSAHPRLEICACLGLLRDDQARRLRAAGVFAYNHNLNTTERFYGDICSTHTFGDRLATIEHVKASGLSPCVGALFGMGETAEDILDLAYRLRALGVDSIPINFLVAVAGTPLANTALLRPQTCLKILCLFRLLNPATELRIAGGREVQLGWLQPLGLQVANSIFVGDYLTTKGQPPAADYAMIQDLGFDILGDPGKAAAPDRVSGLTQAVGTLTTRPNRD